jgi:cation diffusion facilitator CzcD-associated flavoprotein CzcO
MPPIPGLDDARRVLPDSIRHSAEPVDERRLSGTSVAVLGGGATGFDCAATALEAGAREVVMFLRRPHLPQINKSKWTSFPGFLHGYSGLADRDRFDLYAYIFAAQVPPPYESVLRCSAHPQFSILFSRPWQRVDAEDGKVMIATPHGRQAFDVALLATGFDVDLLMRPEIAGVRENILLWSDRVDLVRAAAEPELGRFPYLGPAFELMERRIGATPGLDRVHMFSWGVTLSHGALAGDIPGLAIGVDRLTQGLVGGLFRDDLTHHRARLEAFDERELKPTRYFVP